MKLVNIVGARPNFMKIAPIMQYLKNHKTIHPILLHTGQHYDAKMSHLFFNELEIPKPDFNLEVGSDTQAKQVAKIMERFDDICIKIKPDAIMVVGDVNSTAACSLVAAKMGIKVIHLEAGLRSYDRTMPEEINRLVTDVLADLLLTPSDDANENLKNEGISEDKIVKVGNIMIDTLFHFLPKAEKSQVLQKLSVNKEEYCLITLHRPSNVDFKDKLNGIIDVIERIQSEIPVVLPMHPRTLKNISEFGLEGKVRSMKNLIVQEPLGYLDFQKLMSNSRFVVTDSGGVQEETTALRIPCITVRDNTERPITVSEGSNELAGTNPEVVLDFALKALKGEWKKSKIPKMWDGNTSERVISAIESKLL